MKTTHSCTGLIEKIATRDRYRMVIREPNGRNVIADFLSTPDPKPRKGKTVTIRGNFKSEGSTTLWLGECRIAGNEYI